MERGLFLTAGSARASFSDVNILQINSLLTGGGTDMQMLELSRGLHEIGLHVSLAVASERRWESKARETGCALQTFSRRSLLKLAMITAVRSIIRRERIEIIHAHHGRDYWPAVIAAKLAGNGCRVVVTRHLMTRPRRVSRALLLRFSHLIAVSAAVAAVQRTELRGPQERVHLAHGNVDTDRFTPGRCDAANEFRKQQGWSEETVAFGVVGAFDLPRGKGQAEFIEAAAVLARRFPQARFAIIGSGTMEPLLRQSIRVRGLEKIVAMVPFTDDIVPVMRGLDVLVHPAVGTEALGVVLWEAMACGKPVIASRLHGIPEAFIEGEHGRLVPPGEVSALADAMEELLANPALRLRWGEAGRTHVCRNFSRCAHAKRVAAIYRKILADRTS